MIKLIYMQNEDPHEAKYQLLVKYQVKSAGVNHLIDSKAFIKYSNDMDDIYKNIEERNPNIKRKILFLMI